MAKYTVAVLGGDERMPYAGRRLASSGFFVRSFGMVGESGEGVSACASVTAALDACDLVLLPVPLSRDGRTLWAPALSSPPTLSDILAHAPSHARIFGGGELDDARFFDYASRPDFAQANAIPTAEGALLLAMQKLSCTVSGARVGVVGFGRVGKAVAALFRAAGARVTVFARRTEVCAVASVLGYCAAPLSELCHRARELTCLINTVPSPVIGHETLCVMTPSALVLELASEPYGVDFEAARTFGVQAVLARALPGRFSPETAGYAIAHTVLTMLCESGLSF